MGRKNNYKSDGADSESESVLGFTDESASEDETSFQGTLTGEESKLEGAASADEPATSEEISELKNPHPVTAPLVEAAPEPFDELRQLINKLGPALHKLHEYHDKFEELETEAKARLSSFRQHCAEAVASFETIYKRS